MKRYSIGVDIGGTNTDGVLIDQYGSIVAAHKTSTTAPIVEGFMQLLQKLCVTIPGEIESIKALHIGTTHPTNALLEARDLARVGIIRIAGGPLILSPCAGWPQQLLTAINPVCVTIPGGYECDGRISARFSDVDARAAIEQLLAMGVEAIAVVGTFAPLFSEHEERVRQLIREYSAIIPISCSYEIGGIGFPDRENATILNAALAYGVGLELESLCIAARALGIVAPIRISKNDGTLMDCATAREFPVRMLSAGPTNSAVGGARCAGLTDCIVVDVGGTSTDVAIMLNGVPRKSYKNATIADVALNARMPDVLSIALGGGSIVTTTSIGPHSVARSLRTQAQVFGGSVCTLTDVASRAGYCTLSNSDSRRVSMSTADAQIIMRAAAEKIDRLIAHMRGVHTMPAVLVGGGAALFDASLFNSAVSIPEHAGVANALGAAYGQIAATVDTVVSLSERNKILAQLREEAMHKACAAGAKAESVTLIDEQIVPYAYVPGERARVIIMAAGPLHII